MTHDKNEAGWSTLSSSKAEITMNQSISFQGVTEKEQADMVLLHISIPCLIFNAPREEKMF